jgi:hypothetical protein
MIIVSGSLSPLSHLWCFFLLTLAFLPSSCHPRNPRNPRFLFFFAAFSVFRSLTKSAFVLLSCLIIVFRGEEESAFISVNPSALLRTASAVLFPFNFVLFTFFLSSAKSPFGFAQGKL